MTDSADLARQLEVELKTSGVREELCIVNVGTEDQNRHAQEDWSRFVGSLMKLMREGGLGGS